MDALHEKWTATCTFCPTLCLYACPVSNAEGRDTVAPWGKMSLVRWVDQGQIPLDRDAAEINYKCLGCLACWDVCRHDIEVPTVLFEARARAVNQGVAPFEKERFENDPKELLATLRKHAPEERWLDEAQVLLLPGEDTLRETPALVSDVFRAADALNIDYLATGAAAAFDSGYGLYCGGFHDELLVHAEQVCTQLQRYRKLVVAAPHTLYMLRVVYPQLGVELGPEIVDLTTFLLEAVRTNPPTRRIPGVVRYHDPCYLGRHLEIYDAPRELLGLLCESEVQELRWQRNESHCCGGGGGLSVTSPKTAAHAAQTVVDNARELGTDCLVSACASCVAMFRQEAGELCVEHIATLVANLLATPEGGAVK